MMDLLIRWSLRNRAAVLAVALGLLLVGSWLTVRLPVDVFPDLTAPTVTVLTEAHGMAPTEVESQVTFPLEAALNGAPGVRRVRSGTGVGISVVWAEFEWGTDIYRARQLVAEKVALVAADMPPEADRPQLAPISSIMGEILFAAITSDRHDPTEIHTLVDQTLRRRLLAVPGVAQVTPIGGGEREYQVVLRPSQLRARGVTLAEVAAALDAANENASAGVVVSGGNEYLVTGLGRVRTLDDLRATVVATRDGVPVRVGELGEVRTGTAPVRGEGSLRAKPAVILGIAKQPEANTLALTRTLDAALDEIQAGLPAGMRIDRRVFRQADFIEVAVRNVVHALRDGGILVVLVVLVFLANLRASVITLTAIPLSLLAAVLGLTAAGASINTMTLGGMAIAIGALVDDAIIDVENVFRRLRENAARPAGERRAVLRVVYEASVEIRSSIVFATVIIALVFLPLFFLPGVEGRLLQPLGLAYVVALGASLLVAVTVTPALCSLLLPRARAVQRGHEPRLLRALKGTYGRCLAPALRHPWAVTLPVLALFAGAVAAVGTFGRAFLPEFNEGALTIGVVTVPGTAITESATLGRIVEEICLAQPEVTAVGRRTGRAELDEHSQGVEASEVEVTYQLRDRSRDAFFDALRREFALLPGTNVIIGQPISHRIDHMLSGTRASIAVKIFGDDLYQLRTLAEAARAAMAEVPGVVDLSVEPQVDVPMVTARVDRAAAGRAGVAVRDVGHALEAAVAGLPVSRVLEGRNAYDLTIRLEEPGVPWGPATLRDLPVDAEAGVPVPLHAVADVRRNAGPNAISRENGERKIVVSCNVAGRDVVSVVADCRRSVDPLIAAAGYRVEYGGQFEAAADAARVLAVVGLLVVLGIGFLLHLAFGSGRDAALVMLNLPLALIGGVAGVWASGGVLSIASLIGFITVFGIAARNGIMLVSHIRHLQLHEGVTDLATAVRRGAEERLAPILMTALAAGLALVPLALGGGKPGNEIQTPMAIVILGGLLSSMLLNMVVVPALYLRFGRPPRPDTGGAGW